MHKLNTVANKCLHSVLSIHVSSRIFQYALVRRDLNYEIWNGRFVVDLNRWAMGGNLFELY